MPRTKSNRSKDYTATIGFEAKLWLAADTALRRSAFLQTGRTPQVMTERHDNLRNNMDAAETSGASKTAAGSPKGERGGAHQYFLTRFASAEGKNDGAGKCEVRSETVEVKTSRPFIIRISSFDIYPAPSCVVRLLVEMLAPHPNSRIYDPCCGSGGMFVQWEKGARVRDGERRFNAGNAVNFCLN